MTTVLLTCLALIAADPPATAEDKPTVVIVVGAPGEPEFATKFQQWAEQWQAAAAKGLADVVTIGLADEAGVTDHDRLRTLFSDQAKDAHGPLWIVLIGHGTYDGRDAKFNLRGPDVTDRALAEWLAPIQQPVAVLDCSSASGPFLNRLSGANRVIVTATRSGDEQNFARFGQYLAAAIADPTADRDKDGQVSLLEAFLTAASRVAESYKAQSQLATEHALIDDNGDQLGTPADWFRSVRATRRAKDGAALDGVRAHQFHLVRNTTDQKLPPALRQRRDQLELAIAALRDEKPKLSEDAYYAKLEPLLVELARLLVASPAPKD